MGKTQWWILANFDQQAQIVIRQSNFSLWRCNSDTEGKAVEAIQFAFYEALSQMAFSLTN